MVIILSCFGVVALGFVVVITVCAIISCFKKHEQFDPAVPTETVVVSTDSDSTQASTQKTQTSDTGASETNPSSATAGSLNKDIEMKEEYSVPQEQLDISAMNDLPSVSVPGYYTHRSQGRQQFSSL